MRVLSEVPLIRQTRNQAHIEARKDPLPDNADLILVEAYGEVLSEAAWEELLRSLLQVEARV